MVERPKIIAELGINHNGDFDLLVKMARQALDDGADYVKLQTRTPRKCVPKHQWNNPRTWFDGTEMTYIDYKEKMELTSHQLYDFATMFEGQWITSIWDEDSVDFLHNVFDDEWYLYPKYIKIPSAKMTDRSLIEKCANMAIPMMISTGMSTRDEVDEMISDLPYPHKYVVFHCNSSYPTDDKETNLRAMDDLDAMMKITGHQYYEIGFSSHSKSPFPALASMYVGAKWVEVHYTLDRAMKGTDQAASLEPDALRMLTREARRLPIILGDGMIRLYDSELSSRRKLRG